MGYNGFAHSSALFSRGSVRIDNQAPYSHFYR
ncbi:hypothetical protein TSAR_001951 [Trichomalopsis sarcophagae]|uniref:Uncharacterized protein n=1 Tax=Trichomalopsis sarcophagae TaxID=543379 RepID=A0A232FDY6_9HYME|nr:hypothetical protein TSAR_001951 [Trichomalopsis sarcophagae]